MSVENKTKISKGYTLFDYAYISGGLIDKREKSSKSTENHEYQTLFDSFSENAFSYIFMTDYQQMKYAYISPGIKNIIGYSPDQFMQLGLESFFQTVHPDDKSKLKTVHKMMFDYFYNTPKEERKNLKFDYNLRIRTIEQKYIHLLHQITFVKLTIDGEPALDYSTCTDISKYKNDNNVKLTIYKHKNNVFNQIFEYNIADNEISLTKRQSEIMELISQGMTSKQIAEKLFISFDTVKNHRRNIIMNSCTKNMAETMKLFYAGKSI